MSTEINLLKKDFDQLNLQLFESVLSGLPLRNGISIEDACSYFSAVQETFHQQYFKELSNWDTDSNFIEVHEEKVRKSVDMILYGIAKEDNL